MEIAIWTGETFGVLQAERYESELLSSIGLLANDERFGRSCAILAPGYVEAETLKYLRVGRHYVVYAETAADIDILDIVHGARDLPALFASLHESEWDQ